MLILTLDFLNGKRRAVSLAIMLLMMTMAKVSLAISTMLTMTVFLMTVTSGIPPTEHTPIISKSTANHYLHYHHIDHHDIRRVLGHHDGVDHHGHRVGGTCPQGASSGSSLI